MPSANSDQTRTMKWPTMANTPAYNVVINHIGINVPDIDAAVAWYTSVLGFQVINPVTEVTAGEGPAGTRFVQINGPKFGRCRIAYLTSGNGVGFEMFEFSELKTRPFADDWEFWRPGIWHMCITVSDVGALSARIAAAGGRQRTEVIESPAGSGMTLSFCQDPWGNPIELWDASYDRVAQASAAA